MVATKMVAFDLSHFTDFEQVKIVNCYFADFEQVKTFSSHFTALNNNYRFINFLVITFLYYIKKIKLFIIVI